MKRFFLFFLLIGTLLGNLTAQKDSLFYQSKKSNSLLKKSVLPVTLIITGIALNNSDFEKQFTKDVRNKVGNDFEFKIDDYIQYVPTVQMYSADIIGIQSKNHWFDQTKYLAISHLATAVIVHSLKIGINKTRPNNGSRSFPSGHTATAFTGATVLFQEFKDTSPILAYSGFAFSTTTGAFRIMNNAHWLSDVVTGAGISILVVNLVYHIEPLKNFNPFKKDKTTSLIPYYHENEFGIYFSKSF
ncbi:MAG: phosphatase PAP2 family protein [Flavobacteriales bacterium]